MYRARKLLITVPVVALCLSAAACGGQQGGGQGGGNGGDGEGSVNVVASNSIVADLVQNVGGEEVEVTTLVGPNEDVHNFEPSPAVSRELAEADIVFENGLELEPWMDDLYESSGTEAARIKVGESQQIELLTAEEHGHDHGGEGDHDHEGEAHSEDDHEGEHDHEHSEEEHDHEGEGHSEDEHSEDEHSEESHAEEGGHDHAHGEFDPHVWHDPQNATAMVSEIEAALSEADSGNADTYEQNAEEYTSGLEELDAEVEEMISGVPEENRKLVTAHDTFGYYAQAYGFEVVGTSLESFSTEASDPSAGETAELADEIGQTGVPAIFPENVSNEAGTYVEMLRYNSETMSESLG